MKKTGFTLAEILITIAIVGIVSALTIPTFTSRVSTAKIGPKLTKAVSVFESAMKTTLSDSDSVLSELCTDNDGTPQADLIINILENHLKGSKINGGTYTSSNGVCYLVKGHGNDIDPPANFSGLPHQTVFWRSLMIDIDGINSGPNRIARDRFLFQIMNDGSLRPWGGSWEDSGHRWQTLCPKNAKPEANGEFCAGHIMENGLKVEYR